MLLLSIGWLLACVYLEKAAIGNTRVAFHGGDPSLVSAFTRQADVYRLTIAYPDGSAKRYSLSQLGLSLDAKASLQATHQRQTKLANRLSWWRPVPAALIMHEQTTVFNQFLTSAINVTVQPSQDAALTITNGNIRLTDAVTGKRYGLTDPQAKLLGAARNLRPTTVKLQTLKVNPALTADLLAPYKTELEKTVNQPVSFTVGGQAVKPTPAQIASWLDITPDDQTKKVDITVNSGKIAAYINSIAAAAIHPAKAQVDATLPDGSVQVLVPGINGVDVLNKTDVATSVSKSLLNGNGLSFALPVNYQPFQTITAGDYPKWIEVDLTNKRLYAYQHTTLVQTFLVSAGAPATPTVTGQYAIYAKYQQQDMRGENVDGSTYFQPHVPWINYFYRDYAIHGNYWRPLSYFGRINSSHGCVGLIDGDAAWVYDWAPIGTPVITHT